MFKKKNKNKKKISHKPLCKKKQKHFLALKKGYRWTREESAESRVQGAACRLVGKMQVHMPLTESAG
jgi:hypothetical protein